MGSSSSDSAVRVRGREIRALACALLSALLCSRSAASASPDADRLARIVEGRLAIEQVREGRRTLPPGTVATPRGNADLREIVRRRVLDDLRKGEALERIWGRGVSDEELRAELARILASSEDPRALRDSSRRSATMPRSSWSARCGPCS